MNRVLLLGQDSIRFRKGLPSFSKIIIKEFGDGESYIRIPAEIQNNRVTLLHCCYPNQDKSLIRLFLMLQHLKEKGAAYIRVVVPYLPYARTNRAYLNGEVLSSKVICNLIRTSGCDELVTFDAHFLRKEGEFEYAGLKINNISLSQPILSHLKRKSNAPKIVAPDKGAALLLENEKDIGILKKKRGPYIKGKIAARVPEIEMDFSVEGQDVIIIDDIIATGETMLRAIHACLLNGAKNVYCGATHGIFLNNSLNNLKKTGVKEIVSSDSIKSPVSKICVLDALKKLV